MKANEKIPGKEQAQKNLMRKKSENVGNNTF